MEAQPNRVVYGKTLAELGERNPDIVVLEADISKSTNTFHFARRFPDRFFNLGASEQTMICAAAGSAASGKIPFASTFAVFASMRAIEQVRTSVAYPKLNVKIVATNAGVEICGDGVTHQGVEDLATMRAIPNMMVVSPADPVTTRKATEAIAAHVGPVYMRLGRQEAAVIHSKDVEFALGSMIRLRDGDGITLIATGHMVEQALLAADELTGRGVEVRVLDCHTIKPIDEAAIINAARETAGIVTAEDHSVVGGLGTAIAEVTAAKCPALVHRVGLQETFASSGRQPQKLMAHYRMNAEEIVRRAESLLRDATRGPG